MSDAQCSKLRGHGAPTPVPVEKLLSAREVQALEALAAAASGDEWKLVRSLGLPGSPIGWGITLAALERKGLVESMYPSVESAGVPKVWRRRP